MVVCEVARLHISQCVESIPATHITETRVLN